MSLGMSKVKILTRFSALQVLIQGVTALSGFLIVRILDKSQYAAYTIAASLQVLLTVLSDSGVGWGLNAIGGRIWNDSSRLRGLVATALRLRVSLAAIAIPVMVFSAFYLLRKNAVPWPTTLALTAGVIATIWGTFLTTIYSTPLRLYSRYGTVQKFALVGACFRLLLIGSLAFAFLNAVSAIFVTAITLTAQGLLIRKSASNMLVGETHQDESDRDALVGLIKKQFLMTIFIAYQGQISIWIISIFGSAEKVAEVGALTRLAIIFSLMTTVLEGLVAPTLARCQSLGRLVRLFTFTLFCYLLAATLLLACSFAFPTQLLWILGGKYASLTREVPLLVTSSMVAGLTDVIHTLTLSRGWIWHMWTIPFATLLVQISCLQFMRLNSVAGVLVFSIFSLVPSLFGTSYMTIRGFCRSWRMGYLAPLST
jgi:O-antigen/teichoic acid export membrane protein